MEDDEEDCEDADVPPNRFYVATEKNAAICVMTAAWFTQHPGYAHSLFSMERRIRSHFPSAETQLVIGAMISALALETVQYLVLTDAFFVECDSIENGSEERTVSLSDIRKRAVSRLVEHGLLKGLSLVETRYVSLTFPPFGRARRPPTSGIHYIEHLFCSSVQTGS